MCSSDLFPSHDISDAIETALPGLSLQIIVSPSAKCARCWQRIKDVGTHAEHPDLCGRCMSNAFGVGDERRIA